MPYIQVSLTWTQWDEAMDCGTSAKKGSHKKMQGTETTWWDSCMVPTPHSREKAKRKVWTGHIFGYKTLHCCRHRLYWCLWLAGRLQVRHEKTSHPTLFLVIFCCKFVWLCKFLLLDFMLYSCFYPPKHYILIIVKICKTIYSILETVLLWSHMFVFPSVNLFWNVYEKNTGD